MRLGVSGCGGGGASIGAPGRSLTSESAQSWWEVIGEAGGLGRLEPSDRPGEPCGDNTEGEGQIARSRSHEPIAEDGRRDSIYKSSFRDFQGKEEEGKGSGLGGLGKSSLLEVSWTFQIHSFLLPILLPVLTLFISLTLSLQVPPPHAMLISGPH